MTYDDKLQKSFDEVFMKLERYYPERKVFALDSIDGTLRDKLSKLYKVAGFETINEFLKAYGFEIISGDEVKKIRSFVLYTPGNEPDIIKSKVESMLKRLNEYYPDKIILRGMQNDHKKLSQSVSGLYQWLGYNTSRDMLKAYGFDVQHGDAGRQENNYQDLINTLIEKYKDGDKPSAMGVLIYENPELKGQIKTLQNKSNELFGTSLGNHFKEIGILDKKGNKEKTNRQIATDKYKTANEPSNKTYNYFKLAVEGIEKPILCSIYTTSIHEGAYVKVKDAFTDEEMIGCIVETCYNTAEEDMPKPFKEMAKYVRRVGVKERKEIEEAKIIYQLCTVEIKNSNSLQYYISTLQEIEVGDVVKVPLESNKVGFGIVIAVEYISGDKLPIPRKELKEITLIERNINKDNTKTEDDFKTFVESYENDSTEQLSYITPKSETIDGEGQSYKYKFDSVDSIAINGKSFALSGFSYQEENKIEKRIIDDGGRLSIPQKSDYLIVKDGLDHQTQEYKAVLKLKDAGKQILVINDKHFYTLIERCRPEQKTTENDDTFDITVLQEGLGDIVEHLATVNTKLTELLNEVINKE